MRFVCLNLSGINYLRFFGVFLMADGRDSVYFSYWGKARQEAAPGEPYHLLPYHCLDVAALGHEYFQHASPFRRLLGSLGVSTDERALLGWLSFWLAFHDIGKFSESFQGQRPDLVLALQGREHQRAKVYGKRHDSLGWLLWKKVLQSRAETEQWFGPASDFLSCELLDPWVQAVTGHHGQPPEPLLGGDSWKLYFCEQDRDAVIAFLAETRQLLLTSEGANLPNFQDPETFLQTSRELSWWMAGLTVLADWLGSNTDFFPYRSTAITLAEYWDYARQQARKALAASGVLHRRCEVELPFAHLFPVIQSPSPLQHWATTVAVSGGPQIFLLEDVTGAGKTEAAVTLAHRLMAAGAADGFFIGLPSMATANAMYERIAQVYAQLFAGDTSLVLAHGQRNLVESFAASVIPAGPAENDRLQLDASATARCTAWLADHNKRALLAPAGVGTLDQVLLAVLHSKHQSLRLLGLLGKVLVVDEVHACDTYMQHVLEVLLRFHAWAGGSAILLSATLPQHMKQSLLDAFAQGCHATAPLLQEAAYPLVSAWKSEVPDQLEEDPIATRPDVRRTLAVSYVDEEAAIVQVIETALAAGQCVCWMRNTVGDALAARALFQNALPAEQLILFHARFALEDRLAIEGRILDCFGKQSGADIRRGKLVIATQVAEQSLDADWDLVVSDLAPIDRLIQRAGRLRRHRRDAQGNCLTDPAQPDQRGEARLWVFGPSWTEEPRADWLKARFPGSAAVYAHHGQQWLTAKALQKGSITMPEEARSLIESVFGGEHELPPGLQVNADQVEGKGYADASTAQMNTLKLSGGYDRGVFDWWSEAKTPSRLGEASTQVLLACWDEGRLRPWADQGGQRDTRRAWAYSTVRVPERLIASGVEPTEPGLKQAYGVLLESLPDKGQWSVVLVLERLGNEWQGRAQALTKPDVAPKILRWQYSKEVGLRQIETPEEVA